MILVVESAGASIHLGTVGFFRHRSEGIFAVPKRSRLHFSEPQGSALAVRLGVLFSSLHHASGFLEVPGMPTVQ